MPNYYEILNIHPLSDQKTIKAAYRTLMFKYRCHPDLGGNEDRAKEIGGAYHVLSNPSKRKAYDSTLPPEIFIQKSEPLDFIERRRIPRVAVDFTITYKTGSSSFMPAKILDLSYLGCRLQTKDLLEDGSRVIINIGGQIIDGTVRWKRMFHPSIFQRIYEAGIEFAREFEEIDKITITK